MRRAAVILLAIALLAATPLVAQNYVQGVYLTATGGNDALISMVYTEVSAAPTLKFLFTTSDTEAYVMDNTNFTINDSNTLSFGTLGADSEISSNGTDTTWTITSGDLIIGTDTLNLQLEGAVLLGATSTFTDSDATPDVTGNTYWETNTTSFTISDFDGSGIADGQLIYIVSKGAITYDVTSTGLKGGTTNILTASGDLTIWLYDGTNWILAGTMIVANDLS